MGVQIDRSINKTPGSYVFRISGENYHQIGGVLLSGNNKPKFAQLYIYDGNTEVEDRMHSLNIGETRNMLDPNILQKIMQLLDEINPLALFRMAKDRIKQQQTIDFHIRLIGIRHATMREYNAPTTSEVAALIVSDLGASTTGKDIIIDDKNHGLKRITESHPSYMALQYPILSPYGEDSYHPDIPYCIENKRRKTQSKTVTQREFYAYRLQQRLNEGETLRLAGRLYQQYIVDAFTTIEQERLGYIRRNQQILEQNCTRTYAMQFTEEIMMGLL